MKRLCVTKSSDGWAHPVKFVVFRFQSARPRCPHFTSMPASTPSLSPGLKQLLALNALPPNLVAAKAFNHQFNHFLTDLDRTAASRKLRPDTWMILTVESPIVVLGSSLPQSLPNLNAGLMLNQLVLCLSAPVCHLGFTQLSQRLSPILALYSIPAEPRSWASPRRAEIGCKPRARGQPQNNFLHRDRQGHQRPGSFSQRPTRLRPPLTSRITVRPPPSARADHDRYTCSGHLDLRIQTL